MATNRTRSFPRGANSRFAAIENANVPRSSFDRSHGHKTTFDSSLLIPIYLDEALPGDTHNVKLNAFIRMATPLKPIMDNIYVDFFFFSASNRILWDNHKKFMGEQKDPDEVYTGMVPVINDLVVAVGQLGDYFGLPIGAHSGINALPFRMYNQVYNEWFRDQNLIDSRPNNTDDGPDTFVDYILQRRGKRHDYFTSCLPWPQKGGEVLLPLGTSAPITGIGIDTAGTAVATPDDVYETDNASTVNYPQSFAVSDLRFLGDPQDKPQFYADLSNATAATINELRESFQIQILKERDARGGTRYVEQLRSHFGVISPDARQQRPEYLGGGTARVMITPVANTTDAGEAPQGNLAAIGTAAPANIGFTKSFTEHSYILGLMCVRADLTYQRRTDKLWTRQTKYDFYWPALAHLGEQAVLNRELWSSGNNDPEDLDVFGYQERWAEYRYKPSQITGVFRSQAGSSLDAWHLAQDFQTRPLLNQSFIEENVPIPRVVAVSSEPEFLFDGWFSVRTARPMPMYSTPGLIDHF